jgi:hypothetical protein
MLSLGSDVDCIELALRALHGSDDLAIMFFPIRYFAIRASSKNLILFSVEKGLLEGS